MELYLGDSENSSLRPANFRLCVKGENMDIYGHELAAYKREIHSLSDELDKCSRGEIKVDNLTHYSLAMSNRTNLLVVGLCSLVEVFLYELAHDEDAKHSLKLIDSRGKGIFRFKDYLSKTNRINFGTLKSWCEFKKIYELRNSIIHSYGGLVETSQLEKVKVTMEALNIGSSLIGERRIRLSIGAIAEFHKVITNVIKGLRCRT